MHARTVVILSLLVVASSYRTQKHHSASGCDKLELPSVLRDLRSEAVSMVKARSSHWGQWLTLVGLIFIIFLSTAAGATFLGNMLKRIIMDMDTKVIGVDVEMGTLTVSLCRGEIHMKGLKVMNPEGYTSPYLFNADKMVINLGMMSIVTSLGKKIVLKKITLANIDAIIEYDGVFGGTSNIHKLMDNMGHSKDGKVAEGTPDAKPSDKKKMEKPTDGDAGQPEKPGREIIVEKVHLTDIGAKLSTKLAGVRAAISDVQYDDFSNEFGAHMVEDIAWVIIGSLGKTILTNIVGKKAADWLD